MKYGAPRAPAALLSQALFYADLAVLLHYDDGPSASVYAAAIRVAQSLVLFLTAVSYMFSPFVADLYERGERDRLNSLFKSITRWTLGGTIPLLLLFLIAPGRRPARLRGRLRHRDRVAARPVDRPDRERERRRGWIHPDHGGTHGLGPGGVRRVLPAGPRVAIALMLVPRYGPMGAAIAQASALVFSNALRLYLVWRFVRIQPYDRYYARLLIPTAIGASAMIVVHAVTEGPHWGIDLLATGIVGGAIYYVAFLFFGLTPQEKTGALKMVGKVTGRVRSPA